MNPRTLRDALRRLMVAHNALEPGARPCGTPMTTAHAHALLELRAASTPPSVTELAEALGIERTTCSRQCQRMERAGELRRIPHPTDKRAQRLELTPKGRDLANRVDEASAAYFSTVLAHIDPSRQDATLDAMMMLAQALDDASKEGP